MNKIVLSIASLAIVLLLFWSFGETDSSNAQNRIPPAEGKVLVFLNQETEKELQDEGVFFKQTKM